MSRQHSFLPLRPPNHSKRKIPRPPQPQSPVSWGPEKKAAPGIRFPFSFPRFAHSTFDFTPSIYTNGRISSLSSFFLAGGFEEVTKGREAIGLGFTFSGQPTVFFFPSSSFQGHCVTVHEGRAIKPKEMGSPPLVGTGPMRSGYQDCRQLSLRPTDYCCCRLR